jgi:hypothetical protein
MLGRTISYGLVRHCQITHPLDHDDEVCEGTGWLRLHPHIGLQ